jgi:hypothetical protein
MQSIIELRQSIKKKIDPLNEENLRNVLNYIDSLDNSNESSYSALVEEWKEEDDGYWESYLTKKIA